MHDSIEDLLVTKKKQSSERTAKLKKAGKAFGYLIIFFCILLSVVIMLQLKKTINPEIFPELITTVLFVSSIPTIAYIVLEQKYSTYIKWGGPIFIVLAIMLVFWFIG